MRPNQDTLVRLTEQAPLDPLDPATPPAGWAEQLPGQPRTSITAAFVNDVQGELICLQRAFGLDSLPDRRQLSRMVEFGVLPPKDTLVVVDGVSTGDLVSQSGRYRRYGNLIWYGVQVEWGNTDAAIAANDLLIHLPFQTVDSPEPRLVTSSVSLLGSHLQNDAIAGALYEWYNNTASANRMRIRYTTTGMGGPQFNVVIGQFGGVDGANNRILEASLWYQTNGIRNPDWPYVEIVSLQDVYPPLPNAEFDYEYDSAKVADLIVLLDNGVPTGASQAVTTLPAGKGTFLIAAAGNYTVQLRQISSQEYVIS